jgi:hypothetical protein
MPAIISLKTNLKSLGYGDDRPGGASSNQPYIQTPIPEGRELTSPDFLLRNGYLNAVNSAQDVSRLTQYFLDDKSPNGILFTTKQELLERQNVKVNNGVNRIYNPLGTVTQVGVLSTGYYLNKQGFDVFREGYYNGGKTGYLTFTNTSNTLGEDRLSLLFKSKLSNTSTEFETLAGNNLYGITPFLDITNLLSYPGGPGSTLGIGDTNIRIQNSTRTVESIKEDQKFLITFGSTDPKNKFYLNPNTPTPNWLYRTIQNEGLIGWGVSAEYIDKLNDGTNREDLNADLFGNDFILLDRNELQNSILNKSVYQDVRDPNVDYSNDEYVFNYEQILQQKPKSADKTTFLSSLTDFRRTINLDDLSGENVIISTGYDTFNRERQIGQGGYQGSVTTYKGNFNYDTNKRIIDPNIAVSLDQNELGVMGEDIIDFNFTLILNDNPSDDQNRLIDFKAYIENWSDSAQGEWSSIKYMGRAENLYKYNGFSRAGSVTFVVPALSRGDMISNYRKLNALMWAVAPSYSNLSTPVPGLMRGSIVNFTMGNYFRRMPCIIKSINYTEIEGMGWDINRDSAGTIFRKKGTPPITSVEGVELPTTESDLYVGQLPKGIRVQVEFTPLHNFVPQYGEAFIGQDEIYAPPTSSKSIWSSPEDKNRTTSGLNSTI